jgi:inorganic pyrophosphatase/exopolyphosphatase
MRYHVETTYLEGVRRNRHMISQSHRHFNTEAEVTNFVISIPNTRNEENEALTRIEIHNLYLGMNETYRFER